MKVNGDQGTILSLTKTYSSFVGEKVPKSVISLSTEKNVIRKVLKKNEN